MRKGGAFGQKALSSPFSLPTEQGRRAWAPAAVLAGGPGHGGGRGHGEREREARGVDSPLDFREEGPQGGEPWRRAAAGASSVALQLCMYEQT